MPDDHATTAALLSATGSLLPVPCPQCGGALARRSHREGLTEKMISLIYVYPFRCQACGLRFLSLQWGIRYQRIALDGRADSRHPARVPVGASSRGHAGTAPRPEHTLSLH